MLQTNSWSLRRELQQESHKTWVEQCSDNTCTDAVSAASPFSNGITSLLASTGEVLFT